VIALPVVLAPVTIGLIWKLLFHGDYGPAAHLLHGLGLFSESSILGTPTSAFWAVVLVEIWHWTPFFVVVLLAGLESIPPVTYEAARADGASEVLIFRLITLPLLRPVILVALIFRFLDSFKEFDKVFVLTHGGPSSATEFLSVYCWIVSFEHGEIGYGSAITGIAFLMLLATCGIVIWRYRES
jgi:multiple sugar transport system permease protein